MNPQRSVLPSRRRSPRQALRAFTMLKIIVVIAIIGLLVGLAVNNTGDIFGRASESSARIFVREAMKTALTRYRLDMGDYPSTADGLQALVAAPAAKTDSWRGPYVDAPGNQVPLDPWQEAYQYAYPGTHNKGSYDLYSKGADKTAGTADDIGNW